MKRLCLILSLAFCLSLQAAWMDSLKRRAVSWWGGLKKTLGLDRQFLQLPILPQESALKEAHSPDESKRRWKARDLSAEERSTGNRTFILEIYQVVRKTPPSPGELDQWMNVLHQGGGRAGIYRAMVLDRTYAGLEASSYPTPRPVLDFAETFHTRFLVGQWKKEEWQEGNFYRLKRATVESSLELFDAFGLAREEDMYRWYAIVSAHLAEHYPAAFQSETRRDRNRATHFAWAKQMPWQHVRSELIVRLHKVYNWLAQSQL